MSDKTDEAAMLLLSIEAIAVAATEDGHELNPELSGALFWGLAYMATEARKLLGTEAEQ